MGRMRVNLAFANKGRWVLLDEMTGATEVSVQGTGTIETVSLIDRLLVQDPLAAVASGDAASLTAHDRDRILAALHVSVYGPRIDVSVTCVSCGAPFDLDFALPELVDALAVGSTDDYDDEGHPLFRAADDTTFRLPTGTDERAIVGLPPESAVRALLDACVVTPGRDADPVAVQEAMASVAPTVDVDLSATCPECNATQMFRFDLQHYFMSSLRRDRPRVAVEVHQLAKAYGWGFTDVMEMPRNLRKTFVGIVNGEIPKWQVS